MFTISLLSSAKPVNKYSKFEKKKKNNTNLGTSAPTTKGLKNFSCTLEVEHLQALERIRWAAEGGWGGVPG